MGKLTGKVAIVTGASRGTVHHQLVMGMDDPKAQDPMMMARAALLLASEGAAKVNGRFYVGKEGGGDENSGSVVRG